MLQQLIQQQKIVNFCEKIKKFNLNTHSKLCGVDYYLEKRTFKLYIELKNVPDVSCIQEFFPNELIEDFLEYTKYWKRERESSLAFGIKVDENLNTRLYYHVKFDEHYNFKNPHQSILDRFKLLQVNLNKKLKGISIEFDENTKNIVTKNYYYVHNKFEILKILAYENKKQSAVSLDMDELEIYTKTDPTTSKDTYKINIIKDIFGQYKKTSYEGISDSFSDILYIKAKNLLSVYENIPYEYREKVKEDSNILQAEPWYVGKTSDKKITSVYFSLTKNKNNILGI